MTDPILDRLRHSGVVGPYFDAFGQLVVVSGGEGESGGGEGGEGGEGGSSGEEGAGSGQGSGSGESGAGSSTDGDEGGETKLELTQAELDRMIDKRLGRAKTKWEQDLSSYAEAEGQSETDRLKAEKEAADQRAQQVTETANQRLILADAKVAAVGAGAKADRVAALLKLVDLSDVDVDEDGTVDAKAVEKAVKKGLDDYPEFKAAANNGKGGNSGGDFNGQNGKTRPGSLEDAVAARYS